MEDNVWFTYKARIRAHLRLSWLDFHSQLLLVWYAIFGAGLAIVTIRYPKVLGENTDIISALSSLVLLSISMAVANRDFRGRSIAMRQNYLDLQCLYGHLKQSGDSNSSNLDHYYKLLASVENHKEIDDKIFRVFNSHNLHTRKPTCRESLETYIYVSCRFVAIAFLYVLPLLYIWCGF